MGMIWHKPRSSLLCAILYEYFFLKCSIKPNQNHLTCNHVLKDGVFFLHKGFSVLQQGALHWCVRRRKKIHFLDQPVSCPLWLDHIPLDNHKQWQELFLGRDAHVWIGLPRCGTGPVLHYKKTLQRTDVQCHEKFIIWVLNKGVLNMTLILLLCITYMKF